jgi:hypothetical protein
MTRDPQDAARLVANALSRLPPGERPRFLCEVMAHAAAGVQVISGPEAAAEHVYRLADAIVSRASMSAAR